MTASTLTLLLTTSLVSLSLVGASNPIFGGSAFSDCEDCLDRVYNYCPGSYTSKSYAQCLCDGQGAVDFIQCQALCSRYDGFTGASVGAMWQGYCIYFYPELCPQAEQWVDPSLWEGACGDGASSGGGSGSGSDDDSGSGSYGDGDTDDSGSGSGGGDGDEDDVTSSEAPSFEVTTTTFDSFPEPTTTSETSTDSTTTTTSGTTTTGGAGPRPAINNAAASAGPEGNFLMGFLFAIVLPVVKDMMV
ncbi:hypothetical protein V8F06_013084 [Rhypophila decipiens]